MRGAVVLLLYLDGSALQQPRERALHRAFIDAALIGDRGDRRVGVRPCVVGLVSEVKEDQLLGAADAAHPPDRRGDVNRH